MRSGQLGSNEGPFLLGLASEAAAEDYLLQRPDRRAPLAVRSIGKVNGVHMAEIWLYGDPSYSHERLGPEISQAWLQRLGDAEDGIEDLRSQEERSRQAALRNTMRARMAISNSPNVKLNTRRPWKDHLVGQVQKEPDQYWSVKRPLPSDRTNVVGLGCAALEVVWRNETEEEAFEEGLLWSSIGKLDEPVTTAKNALVLVCPQQQRFWATSEQAFVALRFEAADSRGRGRIDAYFLRCSQAMVDRFQAVFDSFKATLHEPVHVHEAGDVIPLTYGFFGPRQTAQDWQSEPFLLTWSDLHQICLDAQTSEVRDMQEVQKLPALRSDSSSSSPRRSSRNMGSAPSTPPEGDP